MIRGIHGLFYSTEAGALRAFIRDKLMLPHTDVGDGWLIFDLPEGDLGVHPTDADGAPSPGTHEISFYCDDIKATVAELRARGVSFRGDIEDAGFGFVTYLTMPGGVEALLYEPKYRKGPQGTGQVAKAPGRGGRRRAAAKRSVRRSRRR